MNAEKAGVERDPHLDCQALRRRILDVTRQMREFARTGGWRSALELASKRQGLLEDYFGNTAERDDDDELIAAVLEADRSLVRMTETCRGETQTELEEHLYKHNAVRAYVAENPQQPRH